MAVNDVNNGGSFYLQSKVYRAQEMLTQFENDKKNNEESEKSNKQNHLIEKYF